MDDLLDEILLDSYEVAFPCKDMNQIDSAEGTDSSAIPTKTRPKQKLGIKFLPNLAILDKGWAGDSSAIVESATSVGPNAINAGEIRPGQSNRQHV
jgi:hypothetical protein